MTVTVQKYTNTLSITAPTSATLTYGETATVTATPQTNGGTNGAITYTSGTPSVVTVSNTTLKAVAGSGSSVIIASMAGTETVKAATATKTITVAKRAITIKADDQIIDYGNSINTGTNKVSVSSGSLATGDTISGITLTPSTSNATTNGTITASAVEIRNSNNELVNDNYTISYATGTLVINKIVRPITMDATKTLSIGMSGTLTFTYEGEDVTLSNENVSLINTSIATVTMTDGTNAGTVNITTKATGNTTITVTVPESTNYLETSKTCTLTVTNKLTRNITMDSTKSVNYGSTGNTITFTYEGEDVTLSNSNVSSSDTSVATVTMTDGNNGGTINITVKNVGTTTITLTIPETVTCEAASKTCVLTVFPIQAGTPSVTANSVEYDGAAHGVTVPNVSDGTIVYSPNGRNNWTESPITRTESGETTVYVKVSGDSNHTDSEVASAKVTVTQRVITIKAKAQTVTYGTAISNNTNQVTVGGSGLVSGHTLSAITLTQSTTNATTNGAITPSAATIKDASNRNVTSNYKITYESGNLTINKAATTAPTVTAYNGTYDGTAHGITVSNVNNGTAVYSANGTTGWTETPITRTESGETTVYVKVSGDSNHADSTVVNAKITIAQREITIKAKNQSVTYGTAITSNTSQVTIGGSGLVSGHTLNAITLTQSTTNTTTNGTITPSAAIIKDASNHDVTSNYKITYQTGNLTISESATTAPTVTAYTGTYDGTAHGITVSNVNGGTAVYSANGTSGWTTSPIMRTDAGETTVYVKVSGDSNHADSTVVSAKITIAQRAVTITAKDQTVNYGTAIANNTNQVTISGLVSGHTLSAITLSPSTINATTNGTIAPSAAIIKDASNHDVTSNYQITYQTGNLTINKVVSTAPTVTAYTGTYDGTAHGITVSNVNGGTAVYSTNGTNGWTTSPITKTDAGETTVYVKVSGDRNHIDSVVVNAKISIAQRAITIKAKDQIVNYGATIANNTNQVTIGGSGLVSGHTLSNITLTSDETSGTIMPSAAIIKDGNNQDVTTNYQITYEAGNLTINESVATAPTVTAYDGTYDGTAHGVTVSNVSGGTLVYSENGTNGWTTSPITRTEVGETIVYVKVSGDRNHKDSSVVTTKITINPRAVTITAKAQSIPYGTTIANNTNQITVSGLATGHTVGAITLTQSTTSVTTNGTIRPSAAVINDASNHEVTANYQITYQTGNLTITESSATDPVATAYAGTYDGAAHGITVSNVIGGTVVYSANGTNGWSVNPITRTDVGEITVFVKVSGDSNHTDSRVVSAKITITKRPITITAKDQTVTYGTAIENSTSQVVIGGNGLVSRHTLSAITLTQSTTNATTNGTITAGAATIKDGNNQNVTGNYQITYKTGKLTINKLTATVPTATAYAGTYDGTAHGITVSNVSGGTVVYSANGTSDWSASPITRTLAGETTVYAKVLGDSNHADSAVVSAKITIAQRELTITAKDQTVNYGTAIANNTNQVTLSGSGLATGDSLNAITLTQSTTSATINGTINPSNAVILNSTSANVTDSYRITYVGGALTINKVQAVAPTLTAYTGTYDEAAHGITVSGGSGGTIVYSTTGTVDWSATPITRTLPGETTVYVKVQGDSSHTDSEVKSAKITINKRTITDLIINGTNFVYTGSRITPEITVKYGTTVLTEGTDYTLTFTNNINVGTASVTATAIADSVYTGTITKTFTIKAAEFTGSVKILGQNIFGETLTADASAIRPEDTTITYKWYSGDPAHGGTVIGTSNSLVLDNAGYVGADIYVVVTATKDNYATKTFTDQVDAATNGYAKVEKAERTISVEDTLDLTYGTSGTIDFTYTGDDVTATATSTNGSVVSVAMNDGVNNGSVTVTPTGAGNTTVKITIPESGGYKKVEATVTVKVNASTMSGDVKITGTNTYGETLTADTTGIRPTGATVSYQWYYSDNNATTGGIPITTGGNGASLVLNNATYVGKHIYVEVVAEKNGYTTKTYVDFVDSENNGTDIVSKADRSISMSPTQNVIFGQTGTVTFTYTGNDVTATAKTTDENIATVTMADGNNRGTVTITPVKAGTTAITVTIPESATHKGITENCALTVEEATMTGTVKVTGENTYGKTLTADTSAIRPTGATFEYKWYAGTELVGTNSTYVVGENAVGKTIKLVVTASMENYEDYTVEDVTDNSNNTTATASKANGWVELAESTGTAFYGTEERSVIITRHHGGTLTASIVGTSTASVAIDTSDSQEKAKITNVNSVNAGNNIRIRVKSAETNVYKAATADFVLTITRSEMSGSISVSGTAASGETITVDASHIYPTGCELTYEWYVSHVKPDSNNSTGTGRSGLPADAVKISGASGSSYQIGTDLDDVYIYVVVKAHDPHNNYEDTEYVAGRTNSVDGAGPELGKITVLNADKTGTVNGNSVEIEIRECYDESGIASYEWQYSTDGIHWTTVKKDNSGESHSEFTHEIPEDDQSAETLYYRVIVNDIYGNSSTSDIVIVHRKDVLNRKGTIRFTTTQTSNEEVVIHTVIKTTTDVVSVKVNGSTFDYSSATIDAQNREITTSFNYKALVNGNFVFEVTDKAGNVVRESINISTIAKEATDAAKITYTVKGATILSNAQIIFTSNETMKIKNPNRYTGITFDTKGYATRITATIDKGASFNAGTEFIFESRNHIDTTVEVEEAILTEVEYVRFTGQNASAREIDSNKVEALASGVSSAQVNVSGTIYSYYGFGPSKPSTSVATSTDLSAAATLGSASKTYSVGVDKQISEMESSGKASVSSASGYTNGNTTGTSSTVSSESFRLKLVP